MLGGVKCQESRATGRLVDIAAATLGIYRGAVDGSVLREVSMIEIFPSKVEAGTMALGDDSGTDAEWCDERVNITTHMCQESNTCSVRLTCGELPVGLRRSAILLQEALVGWGTSDARTHDLRVLVVVGRDLRARALKSYGCGDGNRNGSAQGALVAVWDTR